MDLTFQELVKNNLKTKISNKEATHILTFPYQQYLAIDRSKMGNFWESYCQIAYNDNKGKYNHQLALAEINQGDMPVISLITLKFNTENILMESSISGLFVAELVYAWQQAILDKLNISSEKIELTCIVLESEEWWYEKNFAFLQYRIQFPLCRTSVTTISSIREKAISILSRRKAMQHLPVTPEGDWKTIIDSIVHLEPLLLFRGTRGGSSKKLSFLNIYDVITEDNLEKEECPILPLEDCLLPQTHSDVLSGLIPQEIFRGGKPEKKDAIYWLPLILSVNYSNTIAVAKTENVTDEESKRFTGQFNDQDDDLSKAMFFLQFLSQERAVDLFYWSDVGRALYTSSQGSEEGLEVWINFTEQSDTYSQENCEACWATFEPDKHITYKTLAWFAKQDSKEQYKEWHNNWCNEALEKALTLQHTNVANYIYRLYWLDIACADADKSIWFYFDGNRWIRRQKAIIIDDKINNIVVPNLENLRIDLSIKVQTLSNRIDKQPEEARIKAITELIEKLGNITYLSKVNKAVIVPFHKAYEEFFNYADNNPNLMACKDCVIEADEKGIAIRPGKPEDYITMSTNMHLKRYNFNDYHASVIKLKDWLSRVHVDHSLREEFLKELSSWLRGRNIEKRIPIWTGNKNNSKSMIIRALECAFGDYFGKFPTSMITGKRTQSSNATPELARAKGKHVMIIQETDEDTEKFRKGVAKELSGNDSVYGRGLYKDGEEFIPMFKLVIVCNKVPCFVGNDSAIKDRISLIPFLSTWTDDAPDNEEEQFKQRLFKKDPHFEIKIPLLAPAFLWLLTQYYPKYISEGIKKPNIVIKYTENYWKDQDYYQRYIEERIRFVYSDQDETDPDESIAISFANLYRDFKIWFGENVPKSTPPESKLANEAFKKYMSHQGNKWIGVSINRSDDVLNI